MGIYETASEGAQYIKNIIGEAPDTAIVLGSGLGSFAASINKICVIPYADIPEFPVTTVEGHEGNLIFGEVSGKRILAFQGRFHAYEGYTSKEITLYVRILKILGVENLILTNAAGAVNTDFEPGDLMLIDDHISFFCDSPLCGPNDERFGPRFPSMDQVYSKHLKKTAEKAYENENIKLVRGVYACAKGPMYDTPAEVRAFRTLGVDAIGMSTVPEAIVANHCGINVLGISCITNMGCGILDTPLSHEEVILTGKAVEENFSRLITEIIKLI